MREKNYYQLLFVLLLLTTKAYAGEFSGNHYRPTNREFISREFQKSKESRRRFEEDHSIRGTGIKPFSETIIDNDAPRQILVLPFHFMHLRQTLQFLFLLADDNEYLEIQTPDDKLNWIVKLAKELSIEHPKAFHISHNNSDLISAAIQGKEALEQAILFKLKLPQFGHISRVQIINGIYDDMSQYYLLKFIREFEPSDRLGYDSENRCLAIMDDGEHSHDDDLSIWINRDLPEAKRILESKRMIDLGNRQQYAPSLDIYSRMAIDFSKVDPSTAIPITPEMNDWQTDWPDSAGIRFFIQGKSYDVYFPVKWSSLHTDLAPEHLNLDRDARSFWGFSSDDSDKLNLTPDGMRYFRSSNRSIGEMSNNRRNFGYYPLQTPKIIKAFSHRPLHRIWNVDNSWGLGGDHPSRIISDDKDMCYQTFEEAIEMFDRMPRFEFLWDARSSFFPEHHVSDLIYYFGIEGTFEPRSSTADHSFSPHVPRELIRSMAGFLRVLQKVDKVEEPFSWQYKNEDSENKNEDSENKNEDSEKISVLRKQRSYRFIKRAFFGLTTFGLGLGLSGQYIGLRADKSSPLIEPKPGKKKSQPKVGVHDGTMSKSKVLTEDKRQVTLNNLTMIKKYQIPKDLHLIKKQ